MRLALVHHQFGGGGGLEKYLVGLVPALIEAGHDLSFVTSRVVNPVPSAENLRILKVDRLPISRTLRLLQFDREGARIAADTNSDLILGFGQTTKQDIHRAGGGCHAVYSRSLAPLKRFSPKNRVELDLERRLYTGGETRHFVVNATKVAEELRQEYNVSPDRISVIHTPVDLKRFQPGERPKQQLRQQLFAHRDSEKPAFLFVSLNHRRKGLDALLEIWPEVDADLWIAGAPSNAFYEGVIRKQGIQDRIVWLGKRDDLPDFYRAAEAFVHPTLYDACANTVLQAMASGLPAIVSANDGAKDFVEHEQTGLLLQNPTDSAELLQHVSQVLNLPAEDRTALGSRARNRVSAQTWPNHLDAWNDVFELVMKER